MSNPQLDPIYRKFHHTVFLQAYKILRDEEAARDMVQEAFLRVMRHADKLDGRKDPAGWIRRIVTNLCLDELRKRRSANLHNGPAPISDLAAPLDPGSEPLLACESAELRTLLREGLSTLSPNHLELFLMRETEGMSYAEMAEEVDCPAGTVMSRLFHARKKLQTHLRRGLLYGSAQRRTIVTVSAMPRVLVFPRPRRPMLEPEPAQW